MFKFLIVLLAVCLISVHAFVKRETEPAKTEDTLASLQKQLEELAKTFNEKVAETLNPEQVKKNFNDVVDNLQKAVKDWKANTEATKN